MTTPGDAGPPAGLPIDAPEQTPTGDVGWRQVHPLTPAIRSWRAIVVVIVVIGQGWADDLVRGGGGLPEVELDRFGALGVLIALGVIGLLIGLVVLWAWLSWRMTRYRITEEALELHSGILFRQQRRARLDRLQSVDVTQPLVARLVGLSRLTLEVAGGAGSGVALAYLGEDDARALRSELLARAAGLRYTGEQAPEAPEHPFLEVPVQRLIGSIVLSGAAVGFVLAAVTLIVSSVVAGRAELLFVLGPAMLGTAGMVWSRFSSGFGLRLAISPDGLRLRRGLLEHRAQTVPPGRVQAVRLSQPLLWRGKDWWTVEVNVAGYGGEGGEGEDSAGVLLTVGTRDEALAVAALVIQDVGLPPDEDARAVVVAGLTGRDHDGGFVPAPRRARWLDPIGRRRIGVRVTTTVLLARHGVLHRRLDLVPHARSQSSGLTQGPVQRRLGVASFAVHSTPGPVAPVVPHLDTAVAAEVLAAQVRLSAAARVAAAPDRWMEHAEGVPDPHPC